MGGAVETESRIGRQRTTNSSNKNPKPPTHHSVASTIKRMAISGRDGDGDDGGSGGATRDGGSEGDSDNCP